MKKISLLSIAMLMCGVLSAQEKEVYINPKGGINFSGINDQPEGVSTSNKIGYNAGLDLRLGGGLLFFQPGVFFYQFNQEYSVVTTPANTQITSTQNIQVQTIKVPLQLGINAINTDLFGIRINAGPAFNFPINVKRDDDSFEISRSNYKDVVVGGIVGAGLDLAIFTFDVNYEFGLSDYIDFSESQNLNSGSSKQYVISLNVGVKF